MIILYDSKCKDFDNNGIGILRDTLNCEVSETLNGELVLDLEYPIKSKYVDFIKNENIIKCDAGFDEEQLFRIKNVKPNLETISVYAEHITYDLIDNFIEDIFPQNLNGAACLDWILSHTLYEHNFKAFSNIVKNSSARYVRKNPMEVILGDADNSFVNLWGGELERNNFILNMLTKRGSNKGYKIKYRKNLTGLDFTIDNSDIVTKIMPQGYNGLFLPEKYVDSPIINSYPHPKVKIVEYSNVKLKEKEDDEEGFETEEEAYEELRRLSNLEYSQNNIDKPSVNLKVDFLDLSKTTEYQNYTFLEKVLMGDTVSVELDYTQVEVRVIKTTYDSLLHRYTKLELGEFKSNYIEDSNKNISTAVKKETEEIEMSILGQAKSSATDLIKKATNGYVVLRPAESPTEILIMDTNDVNTAEKIWRWNMNGFAYSKNGINGPYETAIMMDGSIVADFITTGILNANLITAGTMSLERLFGDVLTLGGNNNTSGRIEIKDEDGDIMAILNNEGLTLSNGAKLIGGNGVLSNFKFDGISSHQEYLGYYPDEESSEFTKTQIIINAYVPNNFVIQEAKITLVHNPVGYADFQGNSFFGYSRAIRLYKTDNNDFPRAAWIGSQFFDIIDSSYLTEIVNAFGNNGFTASQPSENNTKQDIITSIDIKEQLSEGQNILILQTGNNPPTFPNDLVNKVGWQQTGTAKAVLNIVGYMK